MTDHDQQHDHDDHDDQRRDAAADAQPLQPVGERIEQIGERHAGDERQQDVAAAARARATNTASAATQNVNCRSRAIMTRHAAGPGASPSTAGFRRIHVTHPFGEIEADRKQGQDRDQRHHQCQHRLGVESESQARPAPGRRTRSAPPVLSLRHRSGLISTGRSTTQDSMIAPTIMMSRDTTRMTSQRGSTPVMPSVT